MRVTTDPTDKHYIGERTCRVWCNDVELTDWTAADDFRRVVETPGRVHHGAVRIDLREEGAEEPTAELPRQPSGFHDMFIWTPDPEPVVDAPATEPVPEPTFAAPAVKAAQKHIPARKRRAGK